MRVFKYRFFVRQIGVGKEHLSCLDAVTAEMLLGSSKPRICPTVYVKTFEAGWQTRVGRVSQLIRSTPLVIARARAHQEHFCGSSRGARQFDRLNALIARNIKHKCPPPGNLTRSNLDNNATRL